MYKLVVISCLLIAAVLVAWSMWAAPAGRQPGDFVFNNGAEVHSLDPHRVSWRHDIRIANALFEGLTAFHIDPPAEGESLGQVRVVPATAERYEVSDDERVYTFHLRPDARWSNGRPVTAADFVWSWKRVMTPVTGADYAAMMFVIRGARQYFDALAAAQSADFARVGLRATDERTLVVELEAPTSYFLELTAFVPFMPVYPPLLQRHARTGPDVPVQNGITMYDELWTRPDRIVTNGPFVLASHWFKREMVLDKSPHYWDREHVGVGRVRALAIEDVNASFKAYQSGQCDFIDGVPRGAARALLERPPADRPADFRAVTAYGTYYYRINCTAEAADRPNPLADPRVRRALVLAIDKDEIVQKVTGMQQPRADNFVPPGLTVSNVAGETFTYRSPPGLAFDPEAAKALLAEAGYPDGADLGEIRLMYNTSKDHQLIADRLAAMWKSRLGVSVVADVMDTKAFGQALKAKEHKRWHAARSGWFGDYRDPSAFLEMFITGDGNNDCGYSDPDVDRWLRQAAQTGDQARRMELFRQAEDKIVNQDAAILPLYHYVDMFMVRPNVRGAWPNIMGMLMLKQVYLE